MSAFPPPPGRPAPSHLAPANCRLRRLGDSDIGWLRELYASTRADEMAPVPWTEAQKHAFLRAQFDLQHRHFTTHHALAEFLAIELADGGAIGRLYLDRSGDADRVVDLALVPEHRGRGIGGALLERICSDAAASGREVELHVSHHNPAARRLYERRGFVPIADSGMHLLMRWSGPRGLS